MQTSLNTCVDITWASPKIPFTPMYRFLFADYILFKKMLPLTAKFLKRLCAFEPEMVPMACEIKVTVIEKITS